MKKSELRSLIRECVCDALKEANEMSFINKARAKSSLEQIKKGKRSDGMGKFDAKVYAIKGTQEIELTDPSDLAKYSVGYKYGLKNESSEINEDAGMVIDVAMGVAVGLMGLWALVQSAPLVGRVFGDAAEYLATKSEKKAKLAMKNQRKETIAPIIAKFKNDNKLAAMYQSLPEYDAMGTNQITLKANNERRKQLTNIGNYIKSKLTPEELVYFRDISAMLRDGDIKESVIKEATMVDFANYYRAYDSDVKAAAKALDKIIEESGAGSEELFDAITDLVDAVRADRDIEESVLKEATVDTINYTKAIKFFNQMKREYFEDEDAQEDFINEIAVIAKQLGITEDVTNDDIIAGFLEDVQDVDVTAVIMVKMLKKFLSELQ